MGSTDINSKQSIFSASVLSASGAAIYSILPLLVGSATESLALTESRAGYLASIHFSGYLLICISAVFWIRRINWQLVAVAGYALLVSGLLAAAFVPVYPLILAALFIAGCGGGILYGLCMCIISDTDDPDRYFAIKMLAEVLLGGVLLLTLPRYVTSTWGFQGLVICVAMVLALLAVCVVWVPARGVKDNLRTRSGATRHSTIPVWLGLFALMLFFGGLSGVWAFAERMANHNQIDPVSIGKVLSMSSIGGAVGALGAAMLGDRYGRVWPQVVAIVALAIVSFILAGQFSALIFGLSCVLLLAMWNFALAYQLGIVANVDYDGRYAVLMASALALGAVIGPAIAGMIIADNHYGYVHIVNVVAMLVATVIFVRLVRLAAH